MSDSLLGPIESAALCLLLGSTPPTEGSVNCGGDRFTINGITYEVHMPSAATVDTLYKAWMGLPGAQSPDVNWDAGSYGPDGTYTSPKGFTNRQQEVASRRIALFLTGQYAWKLIASRAAAILVVNEVEALRQEFGVPTLKQMLDLLYAHGWRDMDGWTTAIGRPLQGFSFDGPVTKADAFWLAWYYAQMTLASSYQWNTASVPDLYAIEGHPYYAFDEYPYLTSFQNWRPSNALLEHETLTEYEGGNPWTFKVDIDTTLDPLLRSSTVPEVASQMYRMFATLGSAAAAIRKERQDAIFSGVNVGNILSIFGKGTKSGGQTFNPGGPGGDTTFNPGAFTPHGGSGGGPGWSGPVFVPGLVPNLPDGVGPGGGTGPGGGKPGGGGAAGGAGGEEAASGWPWWKTALVVVGGAAVVLGGGYAFLRGTGRLKNPVQRQGYDVIERELGAPLPYSADWQVDAWPVGRDIYVTGDDEGFFVVRRSVDDEAGVFEDQVLAEGAPHEAERILREARAYARGARP